MSGGLYRPGPHIRQLRARMLSKAVRSQCARTKRISRRAPSRVCDRVEARRCHSSYLFNQPLSTAIHNVFHAVDRYRVRAIGADTHDPEDSTRTAVSPKGMLAVQDICRLLPPLL